MTIFIKAKLKKSHKYRVNANITEYDIISFKINLPENHYYSKIYDDKAIINKINMIKMDVRTFCSQL